jgi:hypothetical protein
VESQECKGTSENPCKRRRYRKHSSCKKLNSPATENRGNMNNERNTVHKLLHVRQRKLTLLEKVSEYNVIVVVTSQALYAIVCETSWTAVIMSPRYL